jgi:hypothetical protein
MGMAYTPELVQNIVPYMREIMGAKKADGSLARRDDFLVVGEYGKYSGEHPFEREARERLVREAEQRKAMAKAAKALEARTRRAAEAAARAAKKLAPKKTVPQTGKSPPKKSAK